MPDQMRDALVRTLGNFRLLLAQKPVRDASETIAEAEAALAEDMNAGEWLRFLLVHSEWVHGCQHGEQLRGEMGARVRNGPTAPLPGEAATDYFARVWSDGFLEARGRDEYKGDWEDYKDAFPAGKNIRES